MKIEHGNREFTSTTTSSSNGRTQSKADSKNVRCW
ncbi:unnamed protein product [Oikopleura dioica]|uniref:Uncharacterized protein n=1 Tax=Oikopleura dioica TaxID=34765 RepID=E4YDB4_OIKDI|nr:unnamed protein product [Oikopleura dioica]